MLELKESQLIKGGILAGILEAFYCLLVGFLIFRIESFIPNMAGIIGVGAFLLLFVVSAGISGVLVLGLPGMLVIQNRIKDALRVLMATLLTLLGIFLVFILVAAMVTQ